MCGISIMAKSTKALLTGRIQKCKTNPSIAYTGLATHGRRAWSVVQRLHLNAFNKDVPNPTCSFSAVMTARRGNDERPSGFSQIANRGDTTASRR
jgi:hypothetical protein